MGRLNLRTSESGPDAVGDRDSVRDATAVAQTYEADPRHYSYVPVPVITTEN